MDAETIIFRVEGAIAPKSLNPLQRCVLKGSLDDLGYNLIAEKYGYGEGHIRDIGSKLWKDLSPLVGQRVTKSNVRGVLHHWINQFHSSYLLEAGPVHWGETLDLGNFYGREEEREQLYRWIEIEHRRLIGIYGCPGKGKTALTLKVAKQVAPQFERVFWQRLRVPLPLEELLPIWLRFLSQNDGLTIPTSLSKQLDVFLELLSQWRSLLVLDGFDVFFTPQETAAVFLPGYENYGQFLQLIGEVEHKSCLLLTSREKLSGLSTLEGNSSPVRSLKLSGFGAEVGALVLAEKGLSAQQPGLQSLIEQYDGNPTTLKRVAEIIQDLFGGNIEAFLATENAIFPELKQSLDILFLRLSEPEKEVIYWLAQQAGPLTFTEVKNQITLSIQCYLLQTVLLSLEQRSLLQNIISEGEETKFYLSPLIREYVLEANQTRIKEAIPTQPKSDISSPLIQPEVQGLSLPDANALIILPQQVSKPPALKIVKNDPYQVYQDLNASYEDLPIGYYSLNAEGDFVYINKAALELLGGYTKEELLGKSMGDILNDDYRLCFQINFPLFKERGWVKDKELISRARNGRFNPLLMSAKVVRDEQNQFIMTRTFIVDEKDGDRLALAVNISIP